MVKGRKRGNTKAPSPCRQKLMLRSLNYCQEIKVRQTTKLKSSLFPFEELNMRNGDLSTNSEYDNRSNINFPLHHALNQVDLNTHLLDKVILTEVVLRPTEKPWSVGPQNRHQRKMATRGKHA